MLSLNYFLDINECSTRSPCKNGATCVNTFGGYQCNCAKGFQGKDCDQGDYYLILPVPF